VELGKEGEEPAGEHIANVTWRPFGGERPAAATPPPPPPGPELDGARVYVICHKKQEQAHWRKKAFSAKVQFVATGRHLLLPEDGAAAAGVDLMRSPSVPGCGSARRRRRRRARPAPAPAPVLGASTATARTADPPPPAAPPPLAAAPDGRHHHGALPDI